VSHYQCSATRAEGDSKFYKTRKKYGVKKIRIDDKVVLAAMRQWLYVLPNPEYILVNVKNGEPMTSLNITQALTRIFKTHFNKNVSTTLLAFCGLNIG
jgi:hypothetical protein